MSNEEETNQLSAALDETNVKIEFVMEKGGKYQRAKRTYQKARDSLASGDLRRCTYFTKRALEQIEREYEKFSAEVEEPEEEKEEEEESSEESKAMDDDDNDMSWDEEPEEDESSEETAGMDLPPPPPDMIEEEEEPVVIDEEGEEFFDLADPVDEKPDEKTERVKSSPQDEEDDELFDFGEEDGTEPPDDPKESPESSPEEETEEIFDFDEAQENEYEKEPDERPASPPEEEESGEYFDFAEVESETPHEPEERPETATEEEAEELFDFDETEESKFSHEPEGGPEPSPEEEAEELFDFDETGENESTDEPEERLEADVKEEETDVEFDEPEPGRGSNDVEIDPDLDGIEIVGENIAPPDIEVEENAETVFGGEGDPDGSRKELAPEGEDAFSMHRNEVDSPNFQTKPVELGFSSEEENDTVDRAPSGWFDPNNEDEEGGFGGGGVDIGWDEEDERNETEDELQLSKEIDTVREALESAPSFMDLSEVKKILEDAESKLQSGEQSAAREAIDKCKNDLEVRRKEYKESSERFEKAKEMLKKANEFGVDISPARDLLKQAKEHLNSGEISEMGRLSDKCIEELAEEMMEPLTREKMLDLKTKILEYKNAGINIKSAAEVFNTAGILMKERNFTQVMELAGKSEAMAELSKTEFDLENLLDAMENGFKQLKEKDGSLDDIERDIEMARKLQKDGDLEKAHELAVETEKNLREILEPMVNDKLTRLDSTIEKSEKTIYVNEEKEERELAKDAVDQGNFVEAFNRIATALRNLEESKQNSYPLITLRFADMELKENVWNRAKVILKNTGKAHATGIKVELIGPVVVRRLKPISQLNAKEEKEVEIAVRFDGGGSVPVDVEMTYKSAVDGNEHETRDGLWIDVGPVARKIEKPKGESTGGGDRKGAPVIVPGKISRCKICLGVIKKPSMLYECGCGRKYHKSCITRVEECPSCSLPAQDM